MKKYLGVQTRREKVKRIDKLTSEQKAQMKLWAEKWIKIGLRTGETDFETFDKYMPVCYQKAGFVYPKNVVRVKSPMVGAFASSIAEAILKSPDTVRGAVGGAVDGAVRVAVGVAVGGAVGDAVDNAVRVAVRDAVRDAVDGAVGGAVGGAVDGAVRGAVDGAVRVAVRVAVGVAVRVAVGDAVGGAVDNAVGVAVGVAVRDAVDGAVRVAVRGAVGDAVGGAVGDAVGGAVGGAVRVAVGVAVGDAVGGAVGGAVDNAVGGAVGDAVRGAVRDAVRVAVRVAVGDAVRGAVDNAVGGAVDNAVGGAVKKMLWYEWFGGQFWVGGWYYGAPSYVSFFTDICKLELSQDIMERAEAYRKVCESVNYIWANKNFVIVCERPQMINRDSEGRLHSETSKAIEYPDGWGLYAIGGVVVDEYIVMRPQEITIVKIEAEGNQEVKRVMIERYGVGRYLVNSNAKKLDESEYGTLYEKDLTGFKLRMVHVKNSTPLPDGTKKDYFLPVGPDCKTALEAVASTFELTQEFYHNFIGGQS